MRLQRAKMKDARIPRCSFNSTRIHPIRDFEKLVQWAIHASNMMLGDNPVNSS